MEMKKIKSSIYKKVMKLFIHPHEGWLLGVAFKLPNIRLVMSSNQVKGYFGYPK
jgi:hypothetical protein